MRWPRTGVLGPFPFFNMPQLPRGERRRAKEGKHGKAWQVIMFILLGLGLDRGADIDTERSGKLDWPGLAGESQTPCPWRWQREYLPLPLLSSPA